ncbi:MAG: NUDIX domain-containing protein [Prevotella sp.]|nr:NUDIX domain-containing protein [Prevotella sp.]
MMKDNQQEIFPIVDEEGTVIGKATRGECHNGSRLLHAVVHLHVFNSQGDVYLQKRPEWKDIQPGKWDTAVGGHIDYGETPEQALRREVSEELGIRDFEPQFVGKYVFDSKRERELVYVNSTTYDGKICPSKEELDGGRFWTMQEIRKAIGQGVLTPNFESEFQRFFFVERHPLVPFLPENARVLFLGSFPPQKKRWCMEFYYPNFINDHWRIEGEVFFGDRNHFVLPERKAFNREAIVAFCQGKGIAFYDTATAIRRLKDNASDEFLEVVEPTDIRKLLAQLPHCVAIVTTGQKATDTLCHYFDIEDGPKVGESIRIPNVCNRDNHEIRLYRLPSSSRAYPLAFDKKVAAYRKMFEAVGYSIQKQQT